MCLLSSHFAHATPGVWRRRNGHHSARAHARGWRTSRLGVERPMDGSIISDFPSVPFRHISGCPRIGASGACCRSLAKNIGGKEDCSCREPHSRDDKDPDSWTFPGASASGLLFSLLLCLWCCWFLCTPGPPPTKIDRKQQAQPVVVASWLVPRWDQHGRPARSPCWDDEHQARSEQRTSVYETYIANSLNTLMIRRRFRWVQTRGELAFRWEQVLGLHNPIQSKLHSRTCSVVYVDDTAATYPTASTPVRTCIPSIEV